MIIADAARCELGSNRDWAVATLQAAVHKCFSKTFVRQQPLLLKVIKERYAGEEKSAVQLLSTGDAPRDTKWNPAELAAWSQVATTVLASDAAILLY